VNFVFKCKWFVACAVIALVVVSTGCGGVNAGGGASPATFFLPGMAGMDVQDEKTVTETTPVYFLEAPFIPVADSDPS
jgi:hypothetical protein